MKIKEATDSFPDSFLACETVKKKKTCKETRANGHSKGMKVVDVLGHDCYRPIKFKTLLE